MNNAWPWSVPTVNAIHPADCLQQVGGCHSNEATLYCGQWPVWKGQLACSPTPPFPGILAEHLHLVPIPLSYLILHLLSFIPFLTMRLNLLSSLLVLYIFNNSQWPFLAPSLHQEQRTQSNEGRGTVFIIHFHYFLFLFLVLFILFHLASHLGLDELIYWMVEKWDIVHECSGSRHANRAPWERFLLESYPLN